MAAISASAYLRYIFLEGYGVDVVLCFVVLGPPEEIRARTAFLKRAVDACFISCAFRNPSDSLRPQTRRLQGE